MKGEVRLSETVPSERTWPLKVRWRRWTRRGHPTWSFSQSSAATMELSSFNNGDCFPRAALRGGKSEGEQRESARSGSKCPAARQISATPSRKHLLPSRRRVAGFLGEAASSLCRSVLPSQMRAQFPAPAAPGSKAVCRPKMENFRLFFPSFGVEEIVISAPQRNSTTLRKIGPPKQPPHTESHPEPTASFVLGSSFNAHCR